MKKLVLLSLLVLFGCSKEDGSSGSKLFLEKLNDTTWRHELSLVDPGTVDFNKDGKGDVFLRSFLNTSNINDIVFYRDISDLEFEEETGGYCTNISPFTDPEIIEHSEKKFSYIKSYEGDLDENGLPDSTTIEYTIITQNILRRRSIKEDNTVIWDHTLRKVNFTYEENYKMCGYINRRFRGRF